MSQKPQSTVESGMFAEMYARSDPCPVACDACVDAWEAKALAKGMPFDVAIEQLALPDFNPACASCVAAFEAEVEITRAYRELRATG